jgi:hypothetical protein
MLAVAASAVPVRYETDSRIDPVSYCHFSQCRRASGTASGRTRRCGRSTCASPPGASKEVDLTFADFDAPGGLGPP